MTTDFSTCSFCDNPATVFVRQNVIPGKDFPAVPLCKTCAKCNQVRKRKKPLPKAKIRNS